MNENGNFIITTVTKNSKGNYTFRIGTPNAMEYTNMPLVLIGRSKLEGHDYENHIVWLAHIEGRNNNVRLIYNLGYTLDDVLNQSIVKYLRKYRMFAEFTGMNDGYGSDDPFLNEIIDLILKEAPMEEVNAIIDKGQKARIYKNERLWEYQRRKKLDTGKLVFCRFEKSKGGHTGYRGYLRSMSTFSDILRRDGWWNTYSYFTGDRLIDRSTNLDCSNDEQAIWIARIAEVKQDRFGYTNFILEPLTIVASEITGIQNTPALGYLQDTGLFSANYKFDLPEQNYNNDKILEELVKLIPGLKTDNPSWKKKIIPLMEAGRLTIDDLNSWATTPTRYEVLADSWRNYDDYDNMPFLYPHTARHIDARKSGGAFGVSSSQRLEELFYDWEITIFANTRKGMKFDETADDLARLLESWWAEKDEEYDRRRLIEKAERKARRAARKKKSKEGTGTV